MNAYTLLTKILVYSGDKAAISNLTQWLTVHLSKVGIRVNGLAPGLFLTQHNKGLLENVDGSPTERFQKILNSTPMGRFGKTSKLVGALLFLVDGKASSFINGRFFAYSGV